LGENKTENFGKGFLGVAKALSANSSTLSVGGLGIGVVPFSGLHNCLLMVINWSLFFREFSSNPFFFLWLMSELLKPEGLLGRGISCN
jgi:hypothetical protein